MELELLIADLADSVTLGAEGWVPEGYGVLDAGLARVESLAEGPLRATLVERYQRALVCYSHLYCGPSAGLSLAALA
jgi:hypothetical protein